MNQSLEDADAVTNWMVPKISGVVTMKKSKAGTTIDFLTKSNAIFRIFGAAFFGYNKRKICTKDKMVVINYLFLRNINQKTKEKIKEKTIFMEKKQIIIKHRNNENLVFGVWCIVKRKKLKMCIMIFN